MEHYECEGECLPLDGDDEPHPEACNAEHEGYRCTRRRGHTGPHVACSDDECNIYEWGNKSKRRVPLTKEAASAGPIAISIGAVELEIISPEAVWLKTKSTALHTPLNSDDIKRLIRALVMAANLQRTANSGECAGCNGYGYFIHDPDDSEFTITRCDNCQQFASDYEAWLSIIPDETRLSVDEDEE